MVLCHMRKVIQGIDASLDHQRVELYTTTCKTSFYSCLCMPVQWWSNRINSKLSISFNRLWIRFLCIAFIARLDSKGKWKETLDFCLKQVNKCQQTKPLWKHKHYRNHCLESSLCPLGHWVLSFPYSRVWTASRKSLGRALVRQNCAMSPVTQAATVPFLEGKNSASYFKRFRDSLMLFFSTFNLIILSGSDLHSQKCLAVTW